MSFLIPGYLVVDATHALASSALPDAPVELDHPQRPPRVRRLLRTLFVSATVEHNHHLARSPRFRSERWPRHNSKL